MKKKRKGNKLLFVWFGILVLGGLFLLEGIFFGGNKQADRKVLGDSKDSHSPVFNYKTSTPTSTKTPTPSASPTQIEIVPTQTEAPLPPLTPPVELGATITVAPTIEVVKTPEPTQVPEPRVIIKTEKVVIFVPINERSITSESSYVAPVVTKSVFKKIQNKIEQVGRGEFLSKPKPIPTPIAIELKRETVGGDMLEGDVDIVYKLLGERVLLGAQTTEGRQLKIKDEDLRSAEVTLNKILDKKEVKLNLTSENKFALVQGEVVTILDMPIHVNIDNHKIYLETLEGKKELKILPEQAVKEAVELKIFEKLNSDSVPSVEDLGDELAYKVVGDKTYKLFGFLSVKTKQNVYITAETGEVIEGNQPLFTRAVRLFSL